MVVGTAGRMGRRDPRPLVAHLIYRLDYGGLEQVLVELLRWLPAERFRHVVICLDGFDPAFRTRLPRAVSVYALHKPPGWGLGTQWRLARLLRRLRPDILHSANLAALEGQPVAALAGVPVRIHAEHGWDMSDLRGDSRRRRIWRRLLSPWVHAHVAVSGHLADYLTDRVGIPAERVHTIRNGVDCARFTPKPRRSSWPVYTIGSVGRLVAVKDQQRLVVAFSRLKQILPELFPGLRLVILGEGPQRTALEEVVAAAGLGAQVALPGNREDVSAELRRMDLFVLPSLAEGIPMTVLEAMATGVPVVASRVGGVPEVVLEGVTGTLVPPADTGALTAALAGYVLDPSRGRSQGKAGRQRVLQYLDVAGMAGAYETLYERLLCHRRPRAHSIPGEVS
ncbi:TIGR03088 family PEP-CTERM/XrtA system glycosyltransferase [Halorhodospira halophila]|uniref:TIGR03088 family PEP-CTERM/XrtA system glycosyltransferase n=1 Tax=Halorhodospira halophila TaxID=1053 RepID=UPI0019122AE3|nr:TIGR03088 family PEP-CTERM/XrtA system glycosyltransferase [Halorhodospira halophila]MBK5936606.1 sugar transferase [Halorhodospira halophila]